METTSRRPAAIGSEWGLMIFRSSRTSASSRPSMPSMRGTEKPQMSASISPTLKPRTARAAARLTVTDDFPTPPLPDEMARTRVVAGMAVGPARSAAFCLARSIVAAFSSLDSSVQSIVTSVTPGIEAIRALVSLRICARSGHPIVVSAIVTTTAPSSEMDASLAMPRSTMSLPSSGSMTPRRTSMIAPRVGRGSAMGRVYGGHPTCSEAAMSGRMGDHDEL